jgi:DNA-binding transcriptional regulator YiaG
MHADTLANLTRNANHEGMKTRKKPVRIMAKRTEPVASAVGRVRQGFGLTRKTFSRLSGFSERAIAEWESGKPPKGANGQRLAELERLQKALARVMRPSFVPVWLETPNEKFRGLKPLEVIERGEVDRLWRMIFLLESGTPA